MRDNPGDKYKKIDPWKLVGDTFNPDTYIDLGLKIISWPFSIFKKSIPPHAKNNSRIKILIFLISIENNFKNLSLRELKIASNILNCRWIPNNKNGTIESHNSRNIALKTKEPLKEQAKYFLESVSKRSLNINDSIHAYNVVDVLEKSSKLMKSK